LATSYRPNFPDRQYQYTPAFSERARDESPCAHIYLTTLDARMAPLRRPIPRRRFSGNSGLAESVDDHLNRRGIEASITVGKNKVLVGPPMTFDF
jgi:hypothetical protein